MTTNRHQRQAAPADPAPERIASQCVCCGSHDLKRSPAILMPFVAHRAFGWRPVVIDESWGLLTIRNGNAYSICNSLYCINCGFLFLDIRFTEAELSNLYADYRGHDYTSLRESYEPGYAKRNDRLNAGIGYMKDVEGFLRSHLAFPASILDWGGDTGKNTPFNDGRNQIDIYDISGKAVVAGTRRVSKPWIQSVKYSLVVCSNVLEHIPHPSGILAGIKESMDASSILYIEVPLEDIIADGHRDPHLIKRHWHEHINFFSEGALRALVLGVGLEVVDMRRLQASTEGKMYYLLQAACRMRRPA